MRLLQIIFGLLLSGGVGAVCFTLGAVLCLTQGWF
ncbi:hypothetical protein BIZ83_gp079 [Erwinia phage vB_EamM_ChrisDB]|nr:hypothetical protein BIZ83_gp079 [Erwinia phage vB_EamM_ChrisDB]ANZ48774.1 hypothetical protein CHRISDB_212 [Erwinia phage vB_EamM_ChrisDB]